MPIIFGRGTEDEFCHMEAGHRLIWELGVTLKGSGKPTRTCFELGDGAEEGGRPLGTGVYEADRVMAVVESDLAEGAEQLVVTAAVLVDAAGRVVDADLLVLVLGAGVHEDVVLHGHIRVEGLEAVVAQVEAAGDTALVGDAAAAAHLAEDGPRGPVKAPLEKQIQAPHVLAAF